MSPDFLDNFDTLTEAKEIQIISRCKLANLQARQNLEIVGRQAAAVRALLNFENGKSFVEVSNMTNASYLELPSDKEQESPIDTDQNKCTLGQCHHESDDDEIINGKPSHSYISLIANAILASSDKRLVLSEIYSYVLENFTYFRDKGPGWRNSIRHNLSLNECFIKAGRSPNGKGHFWAINPANFEDFSKGDFRRRRAQRRARRAMAFHEFPEQCLPFWYHPHFMKSHVSSCSGSYSLFPPCSPPTSLHPQHQKRKRSFSTESKEKTEPNKIKKRAFDVESLLKDDKTSDRKPEKRTFNLQSSPLVYENVLRCCSPKTRCVMQPVYPRISTPSPLLLPFEHYHNLYHSALAASNTFQNCSENDKLRLPFF